LTPILSAERLTPPFEGSKKRRIANMSWQSYVDDQLIATKMIQHAVICGHDGNIWATSKGFSVQPDELKDLIGKFSSVDQLASTGVTVAGTRYMYLSSEDRALKVVRAKKGTSGVHCIKTTQTYIVCIYKDPVVPEQAASVTEKLGDYLIGVGF